MAMPRIRRRKQPAVTPVPAPPKPRTFVPCCVASCATAGLLWLSFFPVNCGWLAWIALAPWLLLVRADLPNRWRYPIAWLGGFAFYIPALSWMRNGDPGMFYLWFLLALYCSWYFAAALWLIRRLDRRTRLPLTVTVSAVWVALEFARSELMGGFAWYCLGHTQHDFPPAIQVADLAGVAAVSFCVAAVNGLLAELVSHVPIVRGWFGLRPTERRPALRPQALAVAVLLITMLSYGAWRLSESDFATGPRVALLQTSMGQTERNKADVQARGDPLAQQAIEEQDGKLAREALRQSPTPDLVILPETAFPGDWFEIAAKAPDPPRTEWQSRRKEWCEYARQFVRLVGVPTLLGLNAQLLDEQGRGHRYNSAVFLTPQGESLGRYDKIHLIPFGEYLPFRDSLPFLRQLSPYTDAAYEITAGDEQVRIPLTVRGQTYHFGVVICYEVADEALTRGLVRPAARPPADFLVNMTNDGWYMGTAEHAEHLAVSRFAAVECRRPLLRAVNGGISAVIDGNGKIVALPRPTWAESHSVTGVVSAAVPLDTRTSLYARLGDWLPWCCCGLVLVGSCWRRRAAF
jgi:apolipoprotein N-acyltransferase